MTASTSFSLLDEQIQRFIWAEGWEMLRAAQEQAIPLIISGDCDVIIAAPTAAGKTEAAFFPALTHLLQADGPRVIVYVSPLKALINDQFGRLYRLCEQLEIPVWPWHGDISASSKARFAKQPRGVLLITPESLESVLCNRGTSVRQLFGCTSFFIIDELHAFIGTERGKQLQSLMHRIETVLSRPVPRVGLSATLGDMQLAAEFLRPGHAHAVSMIESSTSGGELKVLIKGYEEPLVITAEENPEEREPTTPALIATHLFRSLRGSNNLVFPNSRREVERYTHLLTQLCHAEGVPNEFWPHHGSLSKEIRTETEYALKQTEKPATAICTSSLELGIDIGAVKSIAQIGPPPSVASLRQRLGRSGRRKAEPAILRGFCIEDEIGPHSSLATQLRLSTVEMTAMVLLLTDHWFEPAAADGVHLSTLVQQLLSQIAQQGGATIRELYDLLCGYDAPFQGISKAEFAALVRHLGQRELLMQESSGVLLHGTLGEKFVNHYTFYAAFQSDEEFRIVAHGKPLGTLPVSQMLTPGQRILFAGRTWRVDEVDEDSKTIYVTHAPGGTPPLFSGGHGRTHTRVHQRMRQLLEASEVPSFLDPVAARFLQEARKSYKELGLAHNIVVDQGRELQVMTWMGDATNEAIACLLRRAGLTANPSGPGVEVHKGERTTTQILAIIRRAAEEDPPPIDDLLSDVTNLRREKWDWALPDPLLRRSYASLHLNLSEALDWARTLSEDYRGSDGSSEDMANGSGA